MTPILGFNAPIGMELPDVKKYWRRSSRPIDPSVPAGLKSSLVTDGPLPEND
jgi:hypothetical protein